MRATKLYLFAATSAFFALQYAAHLPDNLRTVNSHQARSKAQVNQATAFVVPTPGVTDSGTQTAFVVPTPGVTDNGTQTAFVVPTPGVIERATRRALVVDRVEISEVAA